MAIKPTYGELEKGLRGWRKESAERKLADEVMSKFKLEI
jgi:hypothetical protein